MSYALRTHHLIGYRWSELHGSYHEDVRDAERILADRWSRMQERLHAEHGPRLVPSMLGNAARALTILDSAGAVSEMLVFTISDTELDR